MITFFVGLISHLSSLSLFGYLSGFLFIGGCFRLVWRLVQPGGGKDA